MKVNKHNIFLKNARKKARITQVEVANKAEISETSYQRIEYGTQQPSLKTALLIAEALNTTVEKIFPLQQIQLQETEKKPDCSQANKNK